MKTSQKCLAIGVFDLFHYGHLRLFKQILSLKPQCELIIAVQEDEYVIKYKPQTKLYYNQQVRQEFLASIKEISQIVLYKDANTIVKELDFDVFCVGEDQNHAGFLEAINYCKTQGKEVLHLKRTPNISSTDIRAFLCQLDLDSNGGGGG